jgi:hypothetical protein
MDNWEWSYLHESVTALDNENLLPSPTLRNNNNNNNNNNVYIYVTGLVTLQNFRDVTANIKFSAVSILCINLKIYISNKILILDSILFTIHEAQLIFQNDL